MGVSRTTTFPRSAARGPKTNRRAHAMRGVRIVYEDDDVIVVEKAAGVLTCPTRRGDGAYTALDALNDYVRKGQLRSRKCVYLVHRLDRETSGIMMVAKTERVQDYFRTHWNEVTSKTYLARVEGHLDAAEGAFESYLAEEADYTVHSVKDPARGKFARTEWRVLSATPATTLVEVRLKSGRKNQIRVHFREAGHPVVGDARYNPSARRGDRLLLHAWKLSYRGPDGRTHDFETAMPEFAQEKTK